MQHKVFIATLFCISSIYGALSVPDGHEKVNWCAAFADKLRDEKYIHWHKKYDTAWHEERMRIRRRGSCDDYTFLNESVPNICHKNAYQLCVAVANLSYENKIKLFCRALFFLRSICLVDCLLEQGLDCNMCNDDGKTLLMQLGVINTGVYRNSCIDPETKKMMDFLLERGADPARQDRRGNTVLHHIALSDHYFEENVHIPEQYKAIVNIKDQYGDTALHIAIDRCNYRLIEQLVAFGADCDCKDRFGLRPTDLIFKDGYFNDDIPLLLQGLTLSQIRNYECCTNCALL